MSITLLPVIPPQWVQNLRSTDGDLPLVALDFKNNRYWVEGHGEVSREEALVADGGWGAYSANDVVDGVGLSAGSKPRLSDKAFSALGTGRTVLSMGGDVNWKHLSSQNALIKKHTNGHFMVVTETFFPASGANAKAEIRAYSSTAPTEYVSVTHSAASAGSNSLVCQSSFSGSPETLTTTWAGDTNTGTRKLAALINTFRPRATSEGAPTKQVWPNFDHKFKPNRVGIAAPTDGALERVCFYRQHSDFTLLAMSDPKKGYNDLYPVDEWMHQGVASQTNTVTVPFPREFEADDLLILWVVTQADNITTPPAGWTQFAQTGVNDGFVASTTNILTAFWKRATTSSATETEPTFSVTQTGSIFITASITIYRGVAKTGNPINSVGTLVDTATRDYTWPQITPTTPHCRIIYAAVTRDTGEIGNSVSGYRRDTMIRTKDVDKERELFYAGSTNSSLEGSLEIFGEEWGSASQTPEFTYRTREGLRLASMTVALEPEPSALSALAIEQDNPVAKKGAWNFVNLSNKTLNSELSIVSGTSGTFEAYIAQNPPRLFYKPASGFVGASQTVTLRETHGASTNSPRDTSLNLTIGAEVIPSAPAPVRRNQPTHWYSGGQPVVQVKVTPSFWNEAWCVPQGFSTPAHFEFRVVIGDENDNYKGQIFPYVQTPVITTASQPESIKYGGPNFGITYQTALMPEDTPIFLWYEWVNKTSGEIIFTSDHLIQNQWSDSAIVDLIVNNNVDPAPDINQALFRRAQVDPVTLQVTGAEEWKPLRLARANASARNVSKVYPHHYSLHGTAHQKNDMKHRRNRLPMTINIPYPDPLPTNFDIILGSDTYVAGPKLFSRDFGYRNRPLTINPTSTTELSIKNNKLSYDMPFRPAFGRSDAKIKLDTNTPGWIKIIVDAPFPFWYDAKEPIYDALGNFISHKDPKGAGSMRVGLVGDFNLNSTMGSTRPIIGSGSTSGGNVGMGTNVVVTNNITALQPSQHATVAVGDILCVAVLTGNETVTPPAGWKLLDTAGFGTPANATNSVRGSIFWKRATSAGETIPNFGTFSHTASCRSFFIKGAAPSGNPFVDAAITTSDTASTTIQYGEAYVPRNEHVGVFGVAFLGRDGFSVGTTLLSATLPNTTLRTTGTTSSSGGTIMVWEHTQGLGYHIGNAGVTAQISPDFFASQRHTLTTATEYVTFLLTVKKAAPAVTLPAAPYVEISNPPKAQVPHYVTEAGYNTAANPDIRYYDITPVVIDTEDYAPEAFGSMVAIEALGYNKQGFGHTNVPNPDGTFGNGYLSTTMDVDATYTAPIPTPTVLEHSIDFTTQTATIDGQTITDFSTILTDYDPTELTVSGLRVFDGASRPTFHQPLATGPLLDVLKRVSDFCIVVEWDQDESGSANQYVIEGITANQWFGYEVFDSYGSFFAADWSGSYVNLGAPVIGRNRIAINFADDKLLVSLNGGSAIVANRGQYAIPNPANGDGPAEYATVHIGCSAWGGSDIRGTIRKIELYNGLRRGPDLVQLSTSV